MDAKQVAWHIQQGLGLNIPNQPSLFTVEDRLDTEKQVQLRLKDKDGQFFIVAILAEAP